MKINIEVWLPQRKILRVVLGALVEMKREANDTNKMSVFYLKDIVEHLKPEVYTEKEILVGVERLMDNSVVKRWGKWSSDYLLYTSPSPRDRTRSRMPSSA